MKTRSLPAEITTAFYLTRS